jgi:hypothetical protein
MINLRTIILVILVLIPISSALPQFPHKPLYCFNNCHGEQGFYYGDPDYCGNCHELFFGNLNFKEQHEEKACPSCHKITDKDTYHILHNVSCSTCHIDNTIPDNSFIKCSSCHIGGLHTSHLNKQCEICHVDTKIKIVKTPTENITENKTNETIHINTSKSNTNYKKITIYEILANIYRQIRDDIYGKNSVFNSNSNSISNNSNSSK